MFAEEYYECFYGLSLIIFKLSIQRDTIMARSSVKRYEIKIQSKKAKLILLLSLILICTGCLSGRGGHSSFGSKSLNEKSEKQRSETDKDDLLQVLSAEYSKNSQQENSIKPVSYSKDDEVFKENKKIVDSGSSLPGIVDLQNAMGNTEIWTFDQTIRATLESDPLLHAGMMTIQEAHADWWTSTLPPNPEFSVIGGTLPFKKITPEKPGGPPQLDMEIAYPIDWFLFAKRAAGMESARIGISMSQAEYADLIRLRVTTTAIAYYDLLEAKALLKLAEEDRDILTRLELVMKRGRDAGGIPDIDYKRVQLDRLQSQQSVFKAQTDLKNAKTRLWSLLGQNTPVPNFDIHGTLDVVPNIQPMPYEMALDMAKENRPDILWKRLRITKACADITVENRNAFPEISPAIGYSHQYQERIGDPDYDGWGIGVGLSVPLFDRNQGNRAKAHASHTRAQYELQAGLIDLQNEIRESEQNLRSALEKTTIIAKDQIDLASSVRDRVIEAYKAGGYHLIDVLNAENSYRETKRLYLTSRADYWRALFTYNSVIGKTTMKGGSINNENE